VKLLLDTCTALWAALGAPELSSRARELFEDPDQDVYLSAVSAWEVSLKYALGKLPLPRPPDLLFPELRERGGIQSLPLDEAAALQLFRLPPLHRDPFDRMLVCQAIVEGMVILTPDEDIRRYPVRTAW
jgi:PIN domain nuclease of toxin-antitoxin system